MTITIEAVSESRRFALLSSGHVIAIQRLDIDGEAPASEADATIAIAELPWGGWISIDLDSFRTKPH